MTGIFAAEGPNGNWIPGDPNEFYWGSVAFLIILAVFIMKGLPAIKAAMKPGVFGCQAVSRRNETRAGISRQSGAQD